jgi:hypothetical protein
LLDESANKVINNAKEMESQRDVHQCRPLSLDHSVGEEVIQ